MLWQQTKQGNLHWVHEPSLHCIILGPNQWDDAEWNEFVAVAGEHIPTQKTVSLNVFLGPVTVSAQQRKRTADSAANSPFARMAVLTDSAMIRGVTTAFGWLMPGPTIKAYKPNEMRAALDWLAREVSFDATRIEAGMNARMEALRRSAA